MERRKKRTAGPSHYLFASDFDRTLSFNDSGHVLCEMLGISSFEERVSELSDRNLVQQGGELAYLLLHDPDFRVVRREHLVEVGKRIELKRNIGLLSALLAGGIDGERFSFFVISAAPEEVIRSALQGVLAPENIVGTRFEYDPESGRICSLAQVPAGYGKVAVLDQLQATLQVPDDGVIYSGDGSSDIHVMLHVNQRAGYTIAVSQARYVAQIAKRTVLCDDALSVLVPVLEDIAGWDASRIRRFFESKDLLIQDWGKVRTDWLTISSSAQGAPAEARVGV